MGNLFVHGVGARSPYGLDALQTALVWRSGKLVPSPTKWSDKRGNAIGSVRARCLPDELVGTPRLIALGAPALAEAARAAGARARGVPLLLAVGEPRPGFEDAATLDTVLALAKRARVEIDRERSVALGVGHAGFAMLVAKAVELCVTQRSGPVIVGAVDSYHHEEALVALDRECRLLAEGAADGFIPSEGAAFLVLASEPSAIAKIGGVGVALEEGGQGDAPDLAKGLCDALRAAAGGASKRVPVLYTDANGERHRVRAWSFVRVRLQELVSDGETSVIDGPDDFGDAGAATGALLAARACVMLATRSEDSRTALIGTMSEGRERGAIQIEAAS